MRYITSISKYLCVVLFFTVIAQQSSAQSVSDKQIKKNVSTISEPLKSVTALEPRVFEYNTAQFSHLQLPQGAHYGFISEEFQQVFPELVGQKHYSYMQGKNLYKKAAVKTVDMEGLIPVLVASIKEQQKEIDQLRMELDELKKKVK